MEEEDAGENCKVLGDRVLKNKKQKTTKLKNKRLKYFQVEEFHRVEGSPYRTLMNHILGLYPFSCVITCPNQ